MPNVSTQRLDIQDTTLVWGNAAEAKAQLREESLRAFLALPLAERLRVALSLLVKPSDGPGER